MRKCGEILRNVRAVLAIEMMSAAQAFDFYPGKKAGKGTQIAYELIREKVPFMKDDRVMYPDIEGDSATHRVEYDSGCGREGRSARCTWRAIWRTCRSRTCRSNGRGHVWHRHLAGVGEHVSVYNGRCGARPLRSWHWCERTPGTLCQVVAVAWGLDVGR